VIIYDWYDKKSTTSTNTTKPTSDQTSTKSYVTYAQLLEQSDAEIKKLQAANEQLTKENERLTGELSLLKQPAN